MLFLRRDIFFIRESLSHEIFSKLPFAKVYLAKFQNIRLDVRASLTHKSFFRKSFYE